MDTAPATLAQFIHSENLRYYLRPMSSITEEEKVEVSNLLLTKEGERILIKYDHDCCRCSVETGQIDYEEYHNTGIKKME